jgi:CubicO group peptidase (beta-lactamase class C family)
MSRRILKTCVGLLSVLALAACPVPPPGSGSATPLPVWREYHDYTGAQHQSAFNLLSGQGFRLISLSIYGDTSDPRYAAVWVQRSGPAWLSEQAMTGTQFQNAFNANAANGFKPVIISATGPADNPLFAAVWEKSANGVIPVTQFGLRRAGPSSYTVDPVSGASVISDPTTIDCWLYFARNQVPPSSRAPTTCFNLNGPELIPSTIAVWGTAQDPRFALVLEPNPARVGWNADSGINANPIDDSGTYQVRFNAQTSTWGRPVVVPLTYDAQGFMSLFRDDSIGGWSARHNMDSAGLDQAILAAVVGGSFPISVQGGGPTGNARYSAIFARTDVPAQRVFVARGQGSAVAAIDSVIQTFMQFNGVHHAGLAVVKGMKLVYARGYTWAPPGYPLADPTTYFRDASLSKTITSLAVQALVSAGKLNDTATAQSYLHWTSRAGKAPVDPNFANITIGELLQHTSGLPDYWPPSAIAGALGKSLPINDGDITEYMMTQTYTSGAPPQPASYSNLGYWTLARVVEKVTGQPFVAAVQSLLGTPLGASRIRLEGNLIADQAPGEARYFDGFMGLGAPANATSPALLPNAYGGALTNLYDGSGGLSTAPVDYAKVVAALNAPGKFMTAAAIDNVLSNSYGFDAMSGSPYHGNKGGLINGLQSIVNFTQSHAGQQDGIIYVVFWGRDDVKFDASGTKRQSDAYWYPEFTDLANAINATTFSSTDLFPAYGIPSF